MRKIIAIGGGEIGRPGYPVKTTEIDREIVRLTGKAHPKVLLIPATSAYKVYWSRGMHCRERIPTDASFAPLSLLMSKKPE